MSNKTADQSFSNPLLKLISDAQTYELKEANFLHLYLTMNRFEKLTNKVFDLISKIEVSPVKHQLLINKEHQPVKTQIIHQLKMLSHQCKDPLAKANIESISNTLENIKPYQQTITYSHRDIKDQDVHQFLNDIKTKSFSGDFNGLKDFQRGIKVGKYNGMNDRTYKKITENPSVTNDFAKHITEQFDHIADKQQAPYFEQYKKDVADFAMSSGQDVQKMNDFIMKEKFTSNGDVIIPAAMSDRTAQWRCENGIYRVDVSSQVNCVINQESDAQCIAEQGQLVETQNPEDSKSAPPIAQVDYSLTLEPNLNEKGEYIGLKPSIEIDYQIYVDNLKGEPPQASAEKAMGPEAPSNPSP